MVDARAVLVESFGRVGPTVHRIVDGLDEATLTWRADPEANTIAWLTWHIARVQDAQLAPLAETEEVWTAGGWAERFDLPFDDSASGYGQSADDVAAVRVPADLLLGYLDAVTAATSAYLATIAGDDLDRVVDHRWDPPVTLAARLVSILADDLQHVGQAAYVRGLAERAR
ncbi:mycothiol transferase [Cellulomonas rhizosphaerae]|uniref:mycothiol transferase n=1 Tax=Cellulomonas rhizosphaerae TaxID=2293719 RepID=UPI0038994BC5